MIKIIIVEDHHVVRASITALLEQHERIEVIGEAENGEELIALVEKGTKADLILSDVIMPKMDGITMLTKLKEMGNTIPVMLLSVLEEEVHASNAFLAGASAYLSKNVDVDELIFSLQQVLKGKRYFASELCINILERYNSHLANFSTDPKVKLTFAEREMNVLKLVADGLTNQEIADKLYLSRRTIEGIRKALLDRTGCKNSPALIRFAVMNGYA